jgi:hypothetical protein
MSEFCKLPIRPDQEVLESLPFTADETRARELGFFENDPFYLTDDQKIASASIAASLKDSATEKNQFIMNEYPFAESGAEAYVFIESLRGMVERVFAEQKEGESQNLPPMNALGANRWRNNRYSPRMKELIGPFSIFVAQSLSILRTDWPNQAHYRLSNMRKLAKQLDEEKLSKIETTLRDTLERSFRSIDVYEKAYDPFFSKINERLISGDDITEFYAGRDAWLASLGRRATISVALMFPDSPLARILSSRPNSGPMWFHYPVHYKPRHKTKSGRPRIKEEEDGLKALRLPFLEQNGVRRGVNPVFYDTGYLGTVPRAIMTEAGIFPPKTPLEKFDEHIYLTCSNRRPEYQIPMDGANSIEERRKIAKTLEASPKWTQTPETIFLTSSCPGKDALTPLAYSTTPEEQFSAAALGANIIRCYKNKAIVELMKDQRTPLRFRSSGSARKTYTALPYDKEDIAPATDYELVAL